MIGYGSLALVVLLFAVAVGFWLGKYHEQDMQEKREKKQFGVSDISDIEVFKQILLDFKAAIEAIRDAKATNSDFDPSGINTPMFDSAFGDGRGFAPPLDDSDFSPESPETGPGPDSDFAHPDFEGSDFSPETPEMGPGPDSDMDIPMFDSVQPAASELYDSHRNEVEQHLGDAAREVADRQSAEPSSGLWNHLEPIPDDGA
jgi:hypothetical protein